MKTTRRAGFTIIEVILFLAVSGALAAALLVGSSVSINQQRYKDSVNSLESFIQDQYNQVVSVSNDRSGTEACGNSANVTKRPAQAQLRGTSDCLVMGRMMTVSDGGTQLTAYDVIGHPKTRQTVASDDVSDITDNYNLAVSPLSPETDTIAWGARVVYPSNLNKAYPLSLLILRSPRSGGIMTFFRNAVLNDPFEVINGRSTVLATDRDICVDAPGGTFQGQRLAVRIDAYAAGPSGVEVPPQSAGACK